MKEAWGTDIVKFNVRAREDVAEDAKTQARRMGVTFNAYCAAAIAAMNRQTETQTQTGGNLIPTNARLSKDCDHEPYKERGNTFCYACGERIT